MHMNNTREPVHKKGMCGSWLRVACVLLVGLPLWSHAEIKLSSDWNYETTCTGPSSITPEELGLMQRGFMPKPVCTINSREIRIDSIAPVITLNSPANNTYTDDTTPFVS